VLHGLVAAVAADSKRAKAWVAFHRRHAIRS